MDLREEQIKWVWFLFLHIFEFLFSLILFVLRNREQRFERVTKNLKVARVFNTLVEELRAIGMSQPDDSQCTDVMAPVDHKDRSPVLLLMGGGMGAGKSTVLKNICI